MRVDSVQMTGSDAGLAASAPITSSRRKRLAEGFADDLAARTDDRPEGRYPLLGVVDAIARPRLRRTTQACGLLPAGIGEP
ncbi:hypothetical protein [Methylobacterium sp. 77]|uniref:hypothetical protein n=1 Tax=Methylobacterium sp. 77 TaxID=1101192 RepID=UPI0003AA9481|nr:hypothetical protein [Methylobacterium sp. 77]